MQQIELGTILKIEKGKKPLNQSTECGDGMLPYVDIQAFEKGEINNYTDGVKCLSCKDGDILIVCDGSRSGLVGKAIKGYVGSTLAKISAEGILNDYLFYFVQGRYALLNTNRKGTGTPHLKMELLKAQKLVVPSLEKQQEIVSHIEELLSQLDSGVEILNKIKAQLKVYRQAVLKDSFQGIDKQVMIGNITDSRLGKMLDKEKNTGIPRKYLRNVNVRWLKFDLTDLLEMKIEESEVEKYTIKKDDLVICEGGEPGRCAVWENDESIFYQKAIHRVRFTDGSNPKFYMYYLWFAAQIGGLRPYFTGTGIKHLTGQSLCKVLVPTAERSTQDKIVMNIEERLSTCDFIEKMVDDALQRVNALRQSILKKSFEGGLL
ncbi:MAG: restriction endonuclease subunit S [Lachnospiraceae bacterium]|nr:restriction endonuclease subunit S [Lachnospiraceae bacterium]